ncbi:MAG TPA: hypothetical protein DCX54_08005 [Flavobacteriales bacterium]|nr:hypothetical protein [Flavobacteriales bacterium]
MLFCPFLLYANPQKGQNTMSNDQHNPQADNDPNLWLGRVKRLLERSLMGCHQIIEFTKTLQAAAQPNPHNLFRYGMLPTEMIVAMHNVTEAIEEALLTFAEAGQPDGFREKAIEMFGINHTERGKELELLCQRVLEDGKAAGFTPVAKITLPPESGIRKEDLLGSLDYLKEMAEKYQYYDFENVPKAMEGACRKKGVVSNPFGQNNQNDEQPAAEAEIKPEELEKYQKMCAELAEDANTLYGQFCAIGSLYKAAIGA